MRYILPAGALTSLNFLRQDYKTEKQVDLDQPPSLIGVPTFFGGTDVVSRDKQTKFIKKMILVLRANLAKEEEITSPEQWEANLTASRVVIAACLYIQSQISSPKSNSKLYNLINKDLGITDTNYLDDEDKEICFLAANRVINSSLSAFSDANAAIRKANVKDLPPFTEQEWSEFSKYVASVSIKKVSTNPYKDYPITSITQPMFGAAFSYTGATIGYLGGDVISQSSKAMSTKLQITTMVGSTLLMLGTTGPMGVALFSQVIASKLVTAFFSISLAHVLGTTMGILGQGVGMGIGLPLDYAYRLLWKASATIINYYSNYPNTSQMTGIRIADGKSIINGIVIEYTPSSDLKTEEGQQTVEITEEGKLLINGKEVTIPDGGVQLPLELINELKAQLKLQEKKVSEEDSSTSTLLTTI
ncbi:type IV secretion protein Dot [Legionella sp. PATHC032]|uniref:type IV secretion protein Dot n=1 Tax=Legionella sp. PATHC032 TaxID=2992039 RepID=UPI001B072AB2|nr:type IV secretion protein Dot [Legionella sp. PATHC032]MCW8420986.1 type IV secretion protein Dot [Legionella sp. PATHC032]HAZ7573883.1 type IV secretion protein Dot [Legionella pneumophila]HBA1634227.1 type IV secretion protein Dot [Legionella pneumophila]